MEKITLAIYEILNLDIELNGKTKQDENGQTIIIEKGFLKQNFDGKTKYYLHKLNSKIQEEKEIIEKTKIELFQKYGDEKDGMITIPLENSQLFTNELNSLFMSEIELEYKPISIEVLERIETDELFPTIYKLIKEND